MGVHCKHLKVPLNLLSKNWLFWAYSSSEVHNPAEPLFTWCTERWAQGTYAYKIYMCIIEIEKKEQNQPMPKVAKLSSDWKGSKDSITHSWIMSIDWLVASCCDDGDLFNSYVRNGVNLKEKLTFVEAEELSADFFRFEDSVRNLTGNEHLGKWAGLWFSYVVRQSLSWGRGEFLIFNLVVNFTFREEQNFAWRDSAVHFLKHVIKYNLCIWRKR